MASSRANLSKKAKLIGIGAAIGLVVGAFSVFMLLTYNPPDKQQEPNVDVAVLMSEISQINELATASQTYTVVEKVEIQSFFGVGVPSIAGRISYLPDVVQEQNGATLGYWNHTCEDTLDKMDIQNLEKDNRVDAGVIWGLVNAEVLPYDFQKTCEDIGEKVAFIRRESKNIIELGGIEKSISRLAKNVSVLNEKRANAANLPKEEIRRLNATLLRLSRSLTNAFYTNAEKYDQDSYGRTILSKPLPLLYPMIKLSGLSKDTLEYRLLYTKMLRNRNRVADAVMLANEYVELFLGK